MNYFPSKIDDIENFVYGGGHHFGFCPNFGYSRWGIHGALVIPYIIRDVLTKFQLVTNFIIIFLSLS